MPAAWRRGDGRLSRRAAQATMSRLFHEQQKGVWIGGPASLPLIGPARLASFQRRGLRPAGAEARPGTGIKLDVFSDLDTLLSRPAGLAQAVDPSPSSPIPLYGTAVR